MSKHICFLALLLGLPFSGLLSPVEANDWTRFRGPNGSGISEATTIPLEFTEADYNWRIELPGGGHSSPVIWEKKAFIMSADQESAKISLVAIATGNGKTLWKKQFQGVPHKLHSKSSYASCTPAVDEDHVYIAWSEPSQTSLTAYSHDGDESWSLDLGPWVSQHGFGTSPIVYNDMVILSHMVHKDAESTEGSDRAESFLLAVDRKTGEERWRTPRENDVAAYSVPCIYTDPQGKDLIICNTSAHGIAAHDPKTGKEVWATQLFDKRSVSSSVVINGLIFGSVGSGGGGNYVVAVDPEKSPPAMAFKVDRQAPYVPTSVGYGKLAFLWYDKGIVSCIDTESGEVVGRQRVGGNYYGSPVRIGDRICCLSEDGDFVVLSATPELKQLARMPLGESSEATPAIADGVLYLRTSNHLISVGGKVQ